MTTAYLLPISSLGLYHVFLFRGQGVFLHLCLEPPEDAEATEIVDLSGSGGPVVRDKE